MFNVEWVQHAVGHGGFHTGRARADHAPPLNWIFDCGAKKTAVFDAYLKAWTTQHQQPIDWLFISHFDTDHVSGLDTLMSRAVVREVMVPYVNERELILQVLHEVDRGRLDRSFFELAADPAAFFLARGAQRVSFIRDGGPRTEAAIGGDPGPDFPRREGEWTLKVDPPARPLPLPPLYRATLGPALQVREIDSASFIAAVFGPYGLRFIPHRAPVSPATHKGLLADLIALVGRAPARLKRPGLGDCAFAIANHARTASGRAQLRKLFKAHVGSSNRSSLSILSVPHVADTSQANWHRVSPVMRSWGEGIPAWLNTGDAELLAPGDLADWRAAFHPLLPQVQVLALPHHGSDKNSDASLQALVPSAVLVAHVKADSSKHPGIDVTAFAGERLACVSGQPGSEVCLHFWLP
ncbi:MBL fold metallo-hydrolase [Caulobacter sp. Root487D2Y]|uniref:MBL fold metallo-hydrolase n=1 Tax=Caulobacter sp. Root487D2Y TaxID=1736547 RepID=UPI0009EB911D|nr:MBL fold metallo-hydrolase [Caulobacter sp. Root487D2Y]